MKIKEHRFCGHRSWKERGARTLQRLRGKQVAAVFAVRWYHM